MQIAIALFLCLALCPAARANHDGRHTIVTDPDSTFSALSVANSLYLQPGFPASSMLRRKAEFKVSPSFFTYHKEESEAAGHSHGAEVEDQDVRGGGGALAWTYGFSDHFGFSFTGFYLEGKGRGIGLVDLQDGPGAGRPVRTYHGSEMIQGGGGAAMLIVDQFGDMNPDSFRMPMIFGLSYVSLRQTLEAEPIVPRYCECLQDPPDVYGLFQTRREDRLNSLGYVVGVSPQFNAGPMLRFMPFLLYAQPFQEPVSDGQIRNLSTGNVFAPRNRSRIDRDRMIGGLEMSLRPYNVGVVYLPSFITKDSTAVQLKYNLAFGK